MNLPITYDQFIERCIPGDVVFVGKGSFVSWAIRTITGKPYSHCGFVTLNEAGQWMMIEADPHEARAVQLSDYKGRKLAIVRHPVPWDDIKTKVWESIGTDYAYSHLLWIALRERLGVRMSYTAAKEYCCSEHVALNLIKGGLKTAPGHLIWPLDWRCSPGRLAEQLDAMGYPVIAETA